MIGDVLFDKWFERLCASFNKSVSAKHKAIWYQEVERDDPEPFRRTMGVLTNGKFWPTFGTYHQIYENYKEFVGVDAIEYCGDCISGWVIVNLKDGKGAAGPCSICYPNSKYGVDPKGLDLKWVMNPVERNENNEPIPPEKLKVLIHELIESLDKIKSFGPGVPLAVKEEDRRRNLERDKARDAEREYENETQ